LTGKLNGWDALGYSQEITACWVNGPIKRTADLLDRALEIVESVPYTVTLRWLFYNLYQEGWFKGDKAKAYSNFSSTMSRLRHSPDTFQERWPIELADDRRDPIIRTQGHTTAAEWLQSMADRVTCNIDKMTGQSTYILIAFEAEAMQSQFEHYTQEWGVGLWPLSGMTSIPYKKRLAQFITWATYRFDLPVTVLYFGDYDDAGMTIPESTFRHVRKWCEVNFEAYRVGLSLDQVQKYKIQDDPGNPNKYQWEAVPDYAAKEIITGALKSTLDQDLIFELQGLETEATIKARSALTSIRL
jgi:hypothetical protein